MIRAYKHEAPPAGARVGTAFCIWDYLESKRAEQSFEYLSRPELRPAADRCEVLRNAYSERLIIPEGPLAGMSLADAGMDKETFVRTLLGLPLAGKKRVIRTGYRFVKDEQGHRVTEKNVHTLGNELNFSPPKSVSVAETFNPELKPYFEEIEKAAVGFALELGQRNIRVARVPNGIPGHTERQTGEWLVTLHWHSMSRPTRETMGRGAPPDPQRHCHVLIENRVLCSDGEERSFDNRELFETDNLNLMEAAYSLYWVDRLQRVGVPVNVYLDRRGIPRWEIEGIPQEACDLFSSRSREIDSGVAKKELELDRPVTPQEHSQIVRDSRLDKGIEHCPKPSLAAYAETARKAGIEVPIVVPGAPVEKDPIVERAARVNEGAIRMVHGSEAVIKRGRLLPAFFQAAIGHLSPYETLIEAERFRTGPEIVDVPSDMRDPRLAPVTTHTMLETESFVRSTAVAKATTGSWAPSPEVMARAIARAKHPPDPGQLATVLLFGSATGLAACEGHAGAGKTDLMKIVCDAYQGAGDPRDAVADRIIVVSTAAATAQRTGESIGADESHSIEGFAAGVESGHITPTERTLVVLDESAMVDTFGMHRLLKAAGPAIIRFLGDRCQLQGIGASGWQKLVYDRIGEPVQLTKVYRQRPDDVAALEDLRTGKTRAFLEYLQARGSLRIAENLPGAIGQMVCDYKQCRDMGFAPDQLVVNTDHPNLIIDKINRFLQADRMHRGELTGPGLVARALDAGRCETFYAGDRVCFVQPFYNRKTRTSVRNGLQATVTGIEGRTVMLRIDDGRDVLVALSPIAHTQPIRLSYAGHATRVQGAQAEIGFTLPGPRSDLHGAYSMNTRFKDRLFVYMDRQTHGPDPVESTEWKPRLKRSATQQLAEAKQRYGPAPEHPRRAPTKGNIVIVDGKPVVTGTKSRGKLVHSVGKGRFRRQLGSNRLQLDNGGLPPKRRSLAREAAAPERPRKPARTETPDPVPARQAPAPPTGPLRERGAPERAPRKPPVSKEEARLSRLGSALERLTGTRARNQRSGARGKGPGKPEAGARGPARRSPAGSTKGSPEPTKADRREASERELPTLAKVKRPRDKGDSMSIGDDFGIARRKPK